MLELSLMNSFLVLSFFIFLDQSFILLQEDHDAFFLFAPTKFLNLSFLFYLPSSIDFAVSSLFFWGVFLSLYFSSLLFNFSASFERFFVIILSCLWAITETFWSSFHIVESHKLSANSLLSFVAHVWF